MRNEARIALLLLAAVTAHIAPACGGAFKKADPEDVARMSIPPRPQAVGVLRSQTSQVTWPISSSSKG